MAFINGNKQVVTNGLVYGVDFINSKTYVSGSSFFRSLAYPNITGSLVAGAAVNSGSLLFTSSVSDTSTLLEVFPFINISSSFTVSWIGRSNSTTEKFFLNQETNNSESLYTTIGTGSNTFALVNKQIGGFTGRVYRYAPSTKAYYTWVYDNGNYLFYINGLPVTSSTHVIASSSLDRGTGRNFSFNGTYLNLSGSEFNTSSSFSGSIDQILIYNRALTYNEVYQNYINNSYKIGPNITPQLSLDPNTYLYVNATNLTDSASISAINTFITGLKTNNLWNKIAVAYPLLGLTSTSHAINLKDPNAFNLSFSSSWSFNNSGSSPSSSIAFISSSYYTVSSNNNNYPNLTIDNSHFTYLSYSLPTTSSNLFGVVQPASIVGGQVYYSGSKAYHVFTASGDLHVGVPFTASVLAIGGGGAGHAVFTGGGGAGGLVTGSIIVQPGSYPVNVGAGGANGPNRYVKVFNGQDTYVFNFTAFGGGRAGSNYATVAGYIAGNSGGSGGGGSPAGAGVTGQGNAGAGSAGGGGGAGTAAIGIDGGSGSYIAEYATVGPGFGFPAGWFAGGGGAGRGNTYGGWGYGGIGGIGGGGTGGDQPGSSIRTGSNGVPNTGGGGGGGGFPDDSPGGRGGSGLVIISYETSSLLALTSSFTVYLTDTSLSGSHNSSASLAVTASGNIGLVSISRTGSATMQLYRNLVSASVTAAASTTPVGPLYINAVNLNNTASGISPYSISYLSYGLGMSTSEMLTYQSLVSQLQTNLKRQNTLLDTYTGAAAAYSLRRIGPSGYFGPAIRVRRDSDNALRDIGFTSDGQLDTVGLLDFVGVTGSGFVQTWYDQSGNGRDATQVTTTRQPFIAISGSVTVRENKPVFQLDSAAQKHLIAPSLNTLIGGNKLSFFAVVQDAGYTDMGANATSGNNGFMIRDFRTSVSNPGFWLPQLSTGGAPLIRDLVNTGSIKSVISIISNESSLTTYNRLDFKGSVAGNYTFNSTNNFLLGSIGGIGSSYSDVRISEIILYNTDQTNNRLPISTNQFTQYATSGSDPDYQAFITATGITQTTQSAALETLVSDLKSYGLWNKMKAIYPMITDKYNLYANTENFNTPSWLVSGSSVTASNAAGPFTDSLVANRLNDSSGSLVAPYIYQTVQLQSGSVYVMSTHARWNGRDYIVLNPDGNSSTWFDIRNGFVSSSIGTVATASITRVSGTVANPSGSWYRCAMVFTSSVSAPSNTSIQLATTDGVLTYDSLTSLSGSYLWGAQLEPGDFISPYLSNNTGTAFTTGSILDQMKFNLKDPRDLTAAVRLIYSGSWNIGFAGAAGNGIDAVAYPNLTPRTAGFTTSSGHISYYQGNAKQSSSGSLFSSRQTAGADNFFSIKTDSGIETTFGGGEGWGAGRPFSSYTFTAPIGFVMSNAYGTSTFLHQRNQILQQSAQATLNNIDSGITINATSVGSVPSGYSSAQCRFLTIGDGLSNYEAKALYWIVQKYQTTLGRQVY